MKKTVNLLKIIIIILIVLILVVSGFFIFRPKEEELEIMKLEKNQGVEFLKSNSISEVQEHIKHTSIELQTSEDNNLFSITNVEVAGKALQLYYQTDENGNFTRVDGSFSVELNQKDISSVQASWLKFCGIVTDFFEVELVSGNLSHNIYAFEGYEIDTYADESLKKVLKGEAEFGLSVVDVDGTYWNASAYMDENDVLQFEFFHSYEKGVYENGSENINLSEIAESEAEQ